MFAFEGLEITIEQSPTICQRAPIVGRISPELQEPVPLQVASSRARGRALPVEQDDIVADERNIRSTQIPMDKGARVFTERTADACMVAAQLDVEVSVLGS